MRAGLLSLCQGNGDKDPSPSLGHTKHRAWSCCGGQHPHSTMQLSSALPHQPRKLQKGWAGAKNPALLILACNAALSCHRSCLSLPQWPPRPLSHGWESHGQAAWPPVALTAPEQPGTRVTLGCSCLQTANRSSSRPAPRAASVPKLHSPRAPQEPVSGSLRVKLGPVPGGHKPCCLVLNQTLPL